MAIGKKSAEIDVVALKQGEITFYILGTAPLYCNRMQEKAKRTLLIGGTRKTASQKAASIKHDPLAEFRNSPYRRQDNNGPTRILMPSTAFKSALGQAAIDMPTDAAKAQVKRLTFVVGEFVPIWGAPLLSMSMVRSAGMNRTPDVRTRARLFPWASQLTVRYMEPMLNELKVATLLSAAGQICGIGDWRQEKGSGSNGLFEIVAQNDQRFLSVVKSGGLAEQDAAFADPVCVDSSTEELLLWFVEELSHRGGLPRGDDEVEEEDEAAD